MAPVSPPAWQQASSYSARTDRLALSALTTGRTNAGALAARAGVSPSPVTSLKVTQRSTPDRWVTVGAGPCFVPPTSTTGGIYVCANDAPYDVITQASHATLARKDLIVARVYDAFDDVGAENKFAIEVITGTAAASPARPATPNQAIELAEVTIPANSTTVTNANIVDLRQYSVCLGGILPVTSDATVPANPYPGQAIFRPDFTALVVYDGAAWNYINFGTWHTYTPVVTGSTSNPSLGSGAERSGSWMRHGKTIHARVYIKFGTSGVTAGSGTYRVSLPVTGKTVPLGYYFGVGQVYDDSAGNLDDAYVRCGPIGGFERVEIVRAATLWNSTNPVANNDALGFSITYEGV